MHLKLSYAKWRIFCSDINVLETNPFDSLWPYEWRQRSIYHTCSTSGRWVKCLAPWAKKISVFVVWRVMVRLKITFESYCDNFVYATISKTSRVDLQLMMTSSNENIFSVTGPLCESSTPPPPPPPPTPPPPPPPTPPPTHTHTHKGQWRGTLMFSFICAWINGWVNNGESGDLRRHRARYDVIIMSHKIPHKSSLAIVNVLQKTDWTGSVTWDLASMTTFTIVFKLSHIEAIV